MSGFSISKKKEPRQVKAFTHVLADWPGGAVLTVSDFTQDTVSEGTPVGRDANGKWHIIKTAKVAATAAETATTYTVVKGHNFTTSDFVCFEKGGKSYKISSISTNSTNEAYDDIKVATTLGAAVAGDILIQATASTADASAFKYTPDGVLGKAYNVETNMFVQVVTFGQVWGTKIVGLGALAEELPNIKVIQ